MSHVRNAGGEAMARGRCLPAWAGARAAICGVGGCKQPREQPNVNSIRGDEAGKPQHSLQDTPVESLEHRHMNGHGASSNRRRCGTASRRAPLFSPPTAWTSVPEENRHRGIHAHCLPHRYYRLNRISRIPPLIRRLNFTPVGYGLAGISSNPACQSNLAGPVESDCDGRQMGLLHTVRWIPGERPTAAGQVECVRPIPLTDCPAGALKTRGGAFPPPPTLSRNSREGEARWNAA
jgi:hypothetical protein